MDGAAVAAPPPQPVRFAPAAPAEDPGFVGTMARGAGSLLGGYFGGAAGANVGSKAGAFISKAFGFGDYVVQTNSLMGENGTASTVPMMHSSGSSIEISHREYLGDLISSNTALAFSSQSFAVNPGLMQTFPWASSIAAGFEQYEILGMLITFNSTTTTYAALGSLGKVCIAAEYNVNNTVPAGPFIGQPFSSIVEMENAQFSVSGSADKSLIHAIECDVRQRPTPLLYLRRGALAVAGSQDLRLYDLCNVQVASVGVPNANQNLGGIYVSYHMRLYKPQLNAGLLGRTIITQQWRGLTPTTANMFGAAGTIVGATTNTIGATAVGTAPTVYLPVFTFDVLNNRLYFPSWLVGGTYIVGAIYQGAAAAAANLFLTVNGTLTNQSSLYGAGPATNYILGGYTNALAGQTSASVMLTCYVAGQPTTPFSNYITFSATAIPGGGTSTVNIFVYQINDQLVSQS